MLKAVGVEASVSAEERFRPVGPTRDPLGAPAECRRLAMDMTGSKNAYDPSAGMTRCQKGSPDTAGWSGGPGAPGRKHRNHLAPLAPGVELPLA